MKDIIARGKTTAKAIIEAIKKFFFPGMEIENEIECEEVLAEKVECTRFFYIRNLSTHIAFKVSPTF